MTKSATTLLLLLIFQLAGYSQQGNSIFYEIIKDDSVVLFMDKHFSMTEKKCAEYFRFTRVNRAGNFVGYFQDVRRDSTILSKGSYFNDKKNGYFEIDLNHTSRKIYCKGFYENDTPIGKWDFFYENGLPERTILFTKDGMSLIKFVDEKGNIKVWEGNGEFKGRVTGLSSGANIVVANGKILNGKPEGKWTSTLVNSRIYCTEIFENGKLVKGIIPGTAVSGRKVYTDKSFLNTFFLNNYLSEVERFRFEKCPDSSSQASTKKYYYNTQNFQSELKSKVQKILEGDMNYQNQSYANGDYYFSLRFSVSSEGVPEGFEVASSWGHQFHPSIDALIQRLTKFYPTKEMYFLLKLHFSGGPIYSYTYKFTKLNSFTW